MLENLVRFNCLVSLEARELDVLFLTRSLSLSRASRGKRRANLDHLNSTRGRQEVEDDYQLNSLLIQTTIRPFS